LTQDTLENAKVKWQNHFDAFPGLKIGVLIGGSCRGYSFTQGKVSCSNVDNSTII